MMGSTNEVTVHDKLAGKELEVLSSVQAHQQHEAAIRVALHDYADDLKKAREAAQTELSALHVKHQKCITAISKAVAGCSTVTKLAAAVCSREYETARGLAAEIGDWVSIAAASKNRVLATRKAIAQALEKVLTAESQSDLIYGRRELLQALRIPEDRDAEPRDKFSLAATGQFGKLGKLVDLDKLQAVRAEISKVEVRSQALTRELNDLRGKREKLQAEIDRTTLKQCGGPAADMLSRLRDTCNSSLSNILKAK